MGDRRAFLVDLAILWAAAFVLGALLTPPDPFTQLLVVGPLLLAAVPVAWWLAYRDGHERLRAALG